MTQAEDFADRMNIVQPRIGLPSLTVTERKWARKHLRAREVICTHVSTLYFPDNSTFNFIPRR